MVLPLEMIMPISRIPVKELEFTAVFDASPWGGGAVLQRDKIPIRFMKITWNEVWAARLQCKIGRPEGQTTWEYVMLLLTLLKWGTETRQGGMALIGDNTASLSAAANLKGRGVLTAISRELSWRKVRHQWKFAVGHLPTEWNKVADALSRLAAPAGSESKTFPPELEGVTEETPPTFVETFALDQLEA